MINANKEKLASFFQGTVQYEVPFFQRAYVWEEENWSTLWEHVAGIVEKSGQNPASEHFIGTIITKQRPAEKIGQQIHDLIDGQQRLTTIAIILRAIAATATGEMPRLTDVVTDNLRFLDSMGVSHQRIIPSSLDRVHYEAVMAGDVESDTEGEAHRLVRAYRFFESKLGQMPDALRENYRLVLLERVSVISMMLAAEDDEQEIFDTINALGVRLTTAELLKNFIFRDKSIQARYPELWSSIYEESEEDAEFWNENKTAGRVIRTNIEVLLYCYLVIKGGGDIRLESLFKAYKQWLAAKTGTERVSFLEELREYAEIYAEFPSGSALNELKYGEWEARFFHVVDNLMITTVLPLVLYIYRLVRAEAERKPMLQLLETYLVRRNVCRLTTKNYNLLFIQVMGRLETRRAAGETVDAAALGAILMGFTDETNRMPSDEEFGAAFGTEMLSNQNAREILFLLALFQNSNGLSDMPKLSLGNYSVEHMMPSKWESHWTDRDMTPLEKVERGRKLRTLGNLTLVTKRLNSKMQNSSWRDKVKPLRDNSSLAMTVTYVDLPNWDEGSIDRRGADLAALALKMWSYQPN